MRRILFASFAPYTASLVDEFLVICTSMFGTNKYSAFVISLVDTV